MKKIVDNCRGYNSHTARKIAIAMLAKRGYNYFVQYRDKQSENALLFSKSEWVTREGGGIYVDK